MEHLAKEMNYARNLSILSPSSAHFWGACVCVVYGGGRRGRSVCVGGLFCSQCDLSVWSRSDIAFGAAHFTSYDGISCV